MDEGDEQAKDLLDAAATGDLQHVMELMGRGVAVDCEDEKQRTPLMLVSGNGHSALVRFLVRRGSNIDAVDGDGMTALMFASVNGHADVARDLLDHATQINSADRSGRTALSFAAEEGHLQVMQTLLDRGADVEAADFGDKSPLMFAAEKDQYDSVCCLVDRGADVNAVDRNRKTPLSLAASNGYADIVCYLVDHGANAHVADSGGMTPLMCACEYDRAEVVRYLVGCKANVNAVDWSGWTPLMFAASQGDMGVVRCLLDNDADVLVTDIGGNTPFSLSVENGHLDVVQELVRRDVDVNSLGGGGKTALMLAAENGHLNVVRFLIDHEADTSAVTTSGDTALFFAANHSHQEIQRLLLQHIQGIPGFNSTKDANASWFISPFEVELMTFVDTGNVGGEYRAKWLDADVVVKLFVPDASNTSFRAEVQLWHQLRHPNVLKLYGACDVGHHFFLCEFASRGSLTDYAATIGPGRLMPWRFLHEAALGLAYLHERKIIHGNLRGSNILIGNDGLAKLADFGLSGSARRAVSTTSSGFVGSMRWQPDEQLRGERPSFASDIYSLGMCIVESATGEVPWAYEPDRSVSFAKWQWDPDLHGQDEWSPAQLSDDVWALLKRMCCQDPGCRAQASTVAHMLERMEAEANEDDTRTSKPENPMDVNEFEDGKLMQLWSEIHTLASPTSELSTLQQQMQLDLEDLFARLQQSRQSRGLLSRFREMLLDFRRMIEGGRQQNRILRLSSTRATCSNMDGLHRRINLLWDMLDGVSNRVEKQKSWKELRARDSELFISEMSNSWLVVNELESEEDRRALLAFLKAEIEAHGSSYSQGQLNVMKQAYADITKQSGADLSATTPPWFLPWYELLIDKWSCLGVGGFGSVYRAKWLDSEVVVKQVMKSGGDKFDDGSFESLTSSLSIAPTKGSTVNASQESERLEARKMFEQEVGIWFNLSHPHVVRLFGACHVGTPFFVCEYASKGSLEEYLRAHPDELWQKLYEAALGIQYLHARGIVHGDLKCNNIVVGSDGKAKVTDFGLSSLSSQESSRISGAWHWVAPECLTGDNPRPTLASDIYSLGMCLVEALRVVEAAMVKTDELSHPPLPWGSLPNTVVKYHVTQRRVLPPRPAPCSENQWVLIEKMCAYDPNQRTKVCTVVEELAQVGEISNADASGKTKNGSSRDAGKLSLSISDVISETKELLKMQLHDVESSNHAMMCHVYGLLWDRLAHVDTQISNNQAGDCTLGPLVESSRVATMKLGHLAGTLAEFNEVVLRGYALHRRLDTFVASNFLQSDGHEESLHNWKHTCEGILAGEAQIIMRVDDSA